LKTKEENNNQNKWKIETEEYIFVYLGSVVEKMAKHKSRQVKELKRLETYAT
jgi:hypothetical protein